MPQERHSTDPSLLPSRALRLAALGALAQCDRDYASLVQEIHELTLAIVGPSPDAFGSSLELLRYEGWITGGEEGHGMVSITPEGLTEFVQLLTTRLRKPSGEFNRLWLALKLRFMPQLPVDAQAVELDRMITLFETEIDRLSALRRSAMTSDGHIGAWIDFEIAENGARLAWCRSLSLRLGDTLSDAAE